MFVRFARCEMPGREDQENFRPAAPRVFVTADEACIRQSRRDDIGFIPMLGNKTLRFAREIFRRPSRQYFPRHGWRPPGADHRRSFRQGSQCFYIRDVYDVLTIYASPMVNWTVQGHCSTGGHESGSRHRSATKKARRWVPKFRFVPIRFVVNA